MKSYLTFINDKTYTLKRVRFKAFAAVQFKPPIFWVVSVTGWWASYLLRQNFLPTSSNQYLLQSNYVFFIAYWQSLLTFGCHQIEPVSQSAALNIWHELYECSIEVVSSTLCLFLRKMPIQFINCVMWEYHNTTDIFNWWSLLLWTHYHQ
jgi:hypothetical protein